MAAMKTCVLLLLFPIVFASELSVPAIIWSNDKSQAYPGSLQGHSISFDTFQKSHLPENLKGHNIVLLLQDMLSVEDFTLNADVYAENSKESSFYHLKNIMSSHGSSFIPGLASPSKIQTNLVKLADKVHNLAAPYDIKSLDLQGGVTNLIVVEMPHSSTMHPKKAFKDVDDVISSVHNQVTELKKPFTALYTAASASVTPKMSNGQSEYHGRHLLQAEADKLNATFFNVSDGCLLFYVRSVVFQSYRFDSDGKKVSLGEYTLPAIDTADGASTCSQNGTKLVVKYANLVPGTGNLKLTKFEFTMEFKIANGYWQASDMDMTYDGTVKEGDKEEKITGNNEKIRSMFIRDIFAPVSYSYHCSSQTPFQSNFTARDSPPPNGIYRGVQFIQFQMQNNGQATNAKFGQVNDCTGFFTIPIWSAIISIGVLMMVFFFGICMLVQVDTQDRFDDPKGKTITVNVSE